MLELTYNDDDGDNNKSTRIVLWLMPVHKKVTNHALLTHVLSRNKLSSINFTLITGISDSDITIFTFKQRY